MTMIEKVAHAMAERSKARLAGLHLLNAVEMDGKEDFRLLAMAAIEALREPTRAMLEAGAVESGEDSEACALGAWEGMIDAALKDQ